VSGDPEMDVNGACGMGSVAFRRVRASLPTAKSGLIVARAADNGRVCVGEVADRAAELLARGWVFAYENIVMGACVVPWVRGMWV
jgi:hypothetical protein